jgi:hypothetical protein
VGSTIVAATKIAHARPALENRIWSLPEIQPQPQMSTAYSSHYTA